MVTHSLGEQAQAHFAKTVSPNKFNQRTVRSLPQRRTRHAVRRDRAGEMGGRTAPGAASFGQGPGGIMPLIEAGGVSP
jgi:hypothetical protein